MRLRCQCPRPPAGRLRAIRPARLIAASVAAVVLGVFALTVTAPPASAQTPCWKQIIDDWVERRRHRGRLSAPLLRRGDQARPQRPAPVHRDHRRHHGRTSAGGARSQDDAGPQPPTPSSEPTSNDPERRRLQPGDRQARPDELRLDPAPAPDPRRPRAGHARHRRRRARLAPPQGSQKRCLAALFALHPTQPLTSQVRSTTAVPPPGRSLVRLDQEVEEWRPRSPQKPHSTRSRTRS